MREDDDPLWKQIVTNEVLWVALAAILVLVIAFTLATSKPAGDEPRRSVPQSRP